LNKPPRGLNDFWHWKDRPTLEIEVARQVLSESGESVEHLQRRKDDPPDCEAVIGGVRCGVEVTEFMHEPTHRATMQGTPQFLLWDEKDFLTELNARIGRKDAGQPKGGPYGRYILIFYTDEFSLRHSDVEKFLRNTSFQTRLVTDAYFALSYEPSSRSYPVVKLHLKAR
jgi:hypothetical protein